MWTQMDQVGKEQPVTGGLGRLESFPGKVKRSQQACTQRKIKKNLASRLND